MQSRGGGSDQPPQQKRLLRTQTAGNLGESIFDSEVLPSSLDEIAPILRVANEVEQSNPRALVLQEGGGFGLVSSSLSSCGVVPIIEALLSFWRGFWVMWVCMILGMVPLCHFGHPQRAEHNVIRRGDFL
ncbi:hypothetical protein LguiA_021842 [Lonicera macranthoides]